VSIDGLIASMSSTVTVTETKAPPTWEQSQSAWIAPGTHLQVAVPMCKQGRLLSIEFDVQYGLDIDFNVMFEGVDGAAIRLYGPSRRARGVSTVLELPADGDAYVTFDNINSWFRSKLVSYSIGFTTERDTEVTSTSRLRFGKTLEVKRGGAEDSPVISDLDAGNYTDVRVAAGDQEDVALAVVAGGRLNVNFEVLEGRDIDFGITLVPEDNSKGPITIYGPSRRTTKLQTSIPISVSGTVHLGFDTSYTWISTKLIRYAVSASNDEMC